MRGRRPSQDGLVAYPFPTSTDHIAILYLPHPFLPEDAERMAEFVKLVATKPELAVGQPDEYPA